MSSQWKRIAREFNSNRDGRSIVNYFVKHGDEKLGPYTLAELHEQLRLGKVAPTDLAQSEGMTDWAEVSVVLGNIPIPASAPPPSVPAVIAQTVPLPVNIHWALLLVLEIVTLNIFNFAWALYLANWARKLDGDNKTLVLIAMYPAGFIAAVIAAANGSQPIGGLLRLAGLVAYVIGIFGIKAAMEGYYNSVERYGLTLSGGMTFFFSTIYLQYHINEIAKWKKSSRVNLVQAVE
jgi:hypothetical protein